jgi:hypothetical protein
MPSTFTSNTGIEKIADGEQTGTWGDTTNLNFDIVDRALNGSVSITLTGTTHTLTTSNGILSDGQFAVLIFSGSPSGTNTVTIAPNTAQKTYLVRNTTTQSVVLTQGSGGNVTVPAGRSAAVYADGGGATAAVVDISAGLVPVLTNAGVTSSTAELNILDGVTSTTAELNILDGVTSTAAELNLVDGSVAGTIVNSKAVVYGAAGQVNATTLQIAGVSVTSTAAELNFVDGVTSNVQTQLNAKQATITGAATTITTANLTVGRALRSNAATGKVEVSGTTATELAHLVGVTSAIQTQLNARALTSTAVTAGNGLTGGGTLAAAMTLTVGAGTGIAVAATTVGLTGQALALHNLATNGLIVRTGAGTVAGRTLVGGTGITMTNGDGVSGNPTAAITIATQAQAEAGTDNTTVMTPLRFRNALRATGSAPTFAARAWVNFNGTGTVAIRASGNVSSITDNGTGDYTVNFTTAMPDANYCVFGSARVVPASSPRAIAPSDAVALQSGSVRIIAGISGGALADAETVSIAIVR